MNHYNPKLSFLTRAYRLLIVFSIFFLSLLLLPSLSHVKAQENQATPPQQSYTLGRVVEVKEEHTNGDTHGGSWQVLSLETWNGEQVTAEYGSEYQPLSPSQMLETGTRVILAYQDQSQSWSVVDVMRLPGWFLLLITFFFFVVFIAGRQGFSAFLGMVFTLFVLQFGVLPSLMQGMDPLMVALVASGVLSLLTIYLTHGWGFSSHVAVVALFSVLSLVALLAYGSVISLQLSGKGSEEALFVQLLPGAPIQLSGLLLAGVILGALGVLDDIITSQVAVVMELAAAKPNITFPELFQRGLRVGKTHVASLVNTLVLAYAGANLPLFILFTSGTGQPWWVTLNSEVIMEEMVRTLVGSLGLVLAVPVSTFIAAAGIIFLPQILSDSHTAIKKNDHAHHHHHPVD